MSVTADAETLWRDAGLDGLQLRALWPSDLDWIAGALALGEGYTRTGVMPETAEQVRTSLAGFGDADAKSGLVATNADASPAAFLLYLDRNRLTDAFPSGDILGILPPDVFPPDGRFLQIFEMWVDPSVRRRGVARALKRVLEAQAHARRARMIYTITEATHQPVLDLNAELGYVEVYRGPMWDVVERVGLAKYVA